MIRRLGASGFGRELWTGDNVKPIMVVMPAYNEAENLNEVLSQMPGQIHGEELGVLVVDDASEDGTRDAVEKNGYPVVSNLINRGGGAALRLGYDILKDAGVKVCITMDADASAKELLSQIQEQNENFSYPNQLLVFRINLFLLVLLLFSQSL